MEIENGAHITAGQSVVGASFLAACRNGHKHTVMEYGQGCHKINQMWLDAVRKCESVRTLNYDLLYWKMLVFLFAEDNRIENINRILPPRSHRVTQWRKTGLHPPPLPLALAQWRRALFPKGAGNPQVVSIEYSSAPLLSSDLGAKNPSGVIGLLHHLSCHGRGKPVPQRRDTLVIPTRTSSRAWAVTQM